MAINPTTPGVYIQEISTLPPSVAPVATAVPGFVGYTEKGTKNKPTRIESMLEFEENFGGAFKEIYSASINSTTNTLTSISGTESKFRFYYAMQMYFGNGGGPCWISSCGSYAATAIDAGEISTAMSAFEQVDEVTLLVAPELANATAGSISSAQDAMLSQCNTLQDRFAIFDAPKGLATPNDDANAFRATVGLNNLKYGATYYPPLISSLNFAYNEAAVTITDAGTEFDEPYDSLAFLKSGIGKHVLVTVNNTPSAACSISITAGGSTVVLSSGTHFKINDGAPVPAALANADVVANVIAAINNHPVLSRFVVASPAATVADDDFFIAAIGQGANLAVAETGTTFTLGSVTSPTGTTTASSLLYNAIKTEIAKRQLIVNPSAAIAGIYASVDRDRGVWKAPANVSVNMVVAPSVIMTNDDQGLLNVNASSGKSINAIRPFTGKGNLVWGARTLAGNDNEWRYVNVRRLFIFTEESIKKATSFVVFEPNDRNTWNRVKGTIENFLTNLWRDGALVGATPKEAFFVNVGLGETMSAQDILEGKMIVQVGMAASRPAEFIILQFQHKLQES